MHINLKEAREHLKKEDFKISCTDFSEANESRCMEDIESASSKDAIQRQIRPARLSSERQSFCFR
jgi:hypothetical protein